MVGDCGSKAAVDTERFNTLMRAGLTQVAALEVLSGNTTEAEALQMEALCMAAADILALPLRERPKPDIAWDLDPANWHRSLDHSDAASFKRDFPDVAVFTIGRLEFVRALTLASKREAGPWAPLYRSKTARLVAHLSAGGRVTPPLVRFCSAGLAVAGGNHRLGWVRHRCLPRLPILISRQEVVRLAPLKTLKDDGGASALRIDKIGLSNRLRIDP